ncbi:phospholipase D family protein [Rhizobium sp. BE258]|uniref:phospholipase D family protein n=1 Tax=Rhizobium sp. BE258 TaxID=2817722 RepID=UPI00285E4A1B|nr:phospholipase D family protein [Rhizobium sp. BE258]MDR7145564.1 hypothetical protein [Rhizobium sp. BE258]
MSDKKSRVTFQEVYYTREFKKRFFSSLSDEIKHAVICSPYFDKLPKPFEDIMGFCLFLKKRGAQTIHVITRPPGDDKQAMTVEMAHRLAAEEIEIFIRTTPYLHAKMYHFEYVRGNFRSFVGSANFTMGGFERNHELVTEIEGVGETSPCHREIQRMQAIGGAMPFAAWIARGQPAGEKERP